VSNLVTNAIKYNRPNGSVDVNVSSAGGMGVLEVRDTGIGIPEEALPGLFHEFHRIRSDATRDIPGTGLGLAICKKIVGELGGTIDVSSRVGEGTSFVVRFQLAPHDEATRPATSPGETA
jgi:signal transduction histidine kinase